MPERNGGWQNGIDRRTYIKGAGTAGVLFLAGCSGNGGGDGGDGGGGDGGDGGGGDGGSGGDGGGGGDSDGGSGGDGGGGGDSDGGDGSGGGGSTDGGAGSLTIGALQPFTGTYDWIADNTEPAYKLAFKQIESAGLLGGKTIKVNAQDTQVKPRKAKQGFTTLDAAGVPAVIGPSSSVMPSLVQPIQNAELPTMTVMAGTIQLDDVGGTWLWRNVPSDAVGGAAAAVYAYDELGHRNMALTFKNDRGSRSFSEAVGAAFEARGGSIKTKVPLPVDASSYRTQVQKLMDANPDIVQMTAGTNISSLFVKNYSQLGAKEEFNLMLGNDVLTPEFIDTVGADVAEGFVGQAPAPGPAYDQFKSAFNDEYSNKQPGAFSAEAYDAANQFALAFQHAGEVSRAVVPESLPKISNPPGTEVTSFQEGKAELANGNDINYTGAANPQNFDDKGNVVGPFSVLKATGGKWKAVTTYTAETLQKVY